MHMEVTLTKGCWINVYMYLITMNALIISTECLIAFLENGCNDTLFPR